MLSFFHEVCVLYDILRKVDLLESLLVHEVESVLILIKELVRTSLDIDSIDFCTGGESILKDTSVLEVAKFSLYECWTFSRLYMLEINKHAWFAVEIKVHSVFEISCCCHKNIIKLL